MIFASESALDIKEGVADVAGSLVKQLANMEFSNALIYAALLLAAVVICFEGYQIYRVALMLIGFCVGYGRAHLILAGFQLSDEQLLMAQAVAGLLLAILAGYVVHVGIFIAAYHFAQENLAAILAPMLLGQVNVSKLLEPVATRLAGVLIAALVAWLAVKSERLVVVLLTAVIGGFAAVNFFMEMVPTFPIDISFFLKLPATVYVFAKLGISAAGVGVQGIRKR